MIQRENDPMTGIINAFGIAFVFFWVPLFFIIQIIRAIL